MLKLVFRLKLPSMSLSLKGDSVKNKPASLFVVPFGTTLKRDFPIPVWQTSGSKLLGELVIASLSQRRINI